MSVDETDPETRVRDAQHAHSDRVARVAVLALHVEGAVINLVTIVRHRHIESLGPFVPSMTSTWDKASIHPDLLLAVRDVPYRSLDSLLSQMFAGALVLDSADTVEYAVEPHAHYSRAWIDWTNQPASEFRSPFHDHSAELVEYWRFDAQELTERWSALRDQLNEDGKPLYRRLCFDLGRFIDRVGNVLVFSALDEVTCEVSIGHDNAVRVSVEPTARRDPQGYRACVWASQGDTPILRELVDLGFGETQFPTNGDLDRCGVQLFRRSDGACVHYTDAYTLRQITGTMSFVGPRRSLTVRRRQRERQFEYDPSLEQVSIGAQLSIAESHQKIYQARRERLADHSERRARARAEVARFHPGRARDVIAQIRRHLASVGGSEVIYLADRYFLGEFQGDVLEKFELCCKLLNACGGALLRILACAHKLPSWWGELPQELTRGVEARGFFRAGSGEPAFHDRWMITPEREILLTNSLNGWQKEGVTLVPLAAGVYRPFTEALWSLPIGEGQEYLIEPLWPREEGA